MVGLAPTVAVLGSGEGIASKVLVGKGDLSVTVDTDVAVLIVVAVLIGIQAESIIRVQSNQVIMFLCSIAPRDHLRAGVVVGLGDDLR